MLFGCERLRNIPGALLAITVGVAASGWLTQRGVALIGTIDLVPAWGMPQWPAPDQWLPSIELAAALVLILYAESYTSIRSFALKHGDPMEPNRELVVLGIANALSGLLHGMPVGAGYSATSANEAAGAHSRFAGLVAALVLALILALLLRVIKRIPQPVLAAIVIHAVSKSWRPSVFTPYLRWKRDRSLALIAVIAVLAFGILDGLLFAIAVSLILLIRQFAMPRLSVLGRLDGGHDFVSVTIHRQAVVVTGELILRPDEPLFFANAEPVFAHARHRVAERASLRRVILSLEESPDLDGTALDALADFAAWLEARGIELRLARLKEAARKLLLRAALPQLPAATLNDWSVDDAAAADASTDSSPMRT